MDPSDRELDALPAGAEVGGGESLWRWKGRLEVKTMQLLSHHRAHQVLGRGRFPASGDLWRAVTFLNRSLRSRGLLFGVHREDGWDVLTIYDTHETRSGDAAALQAELPGKDDDALGSSAELDRGQVARRGVEENSAECEPSEREGLRKDP